MTSISPPERKWLTPKGGCSICIRSNPKGAKIIDTMGGFCETHYDALMALQFNKEDAEAFKPAGDPVRDEPILVVRKVPTKPTKTRTEVTFIPKLTPEMKAYLERRKSQTKPNEPKQKSPPTTTNN